MKLTKRQRLRAVLEMLQSGKLTTATRMSNIFGVSVTTIIRDVNELRAAGYPIKGSPGMGGGTMLRR
jgi:predicted DNA-binding transcriptional regulator YafY